MTLFGTLSQQNEGMCTISGDPMDVERHRPSQQWDLELEIHILAVSYFWS